MQLYTCAVVEANADALKRQWISLTLQDNLSKVKMTNAESANTLQYIVKGKILWKVLQKQEIRK